VAHQKAIVCAGPAVEIIPLIVPRCSVAQTARSSARCAMPKAAARVFVTRSSSSIRLPQKALVILLKGRVLGLERIGRAVFLHGALPVAFVLQGDAEDVVRA
jgi:ribosomal protein L30/L7E